MTYLELIELANKATKAYDEGTPFMSDKEWDDIYFEIERLERETGYIAPNSPTNKIDFQVVSGLKKVTHNHPMLSLDKTKDIREIEEFASGKDTIAMLKLDGLTCSLLYKDGKLVSAETRGNGEVGEGITHNALVINNIPKTIDYKEEIVIDGEMICKYSDFESFSTEYKNPRNFASGSIRLLDSKECSTRKLSFVVWDIISPIADTLTDKLEIAHKLGFEVVPWCTISGSDNLELDIVPWLKKRAEDYPIDGLVFKYNNCAYGASLGSTGHHLKNAVALKFYDETYTTYLRGFDWEVSRTGTLTPVAVFDPVEIDGTTVTRASVHNLTILEEIFGTPYEGQEIEIFKANQIIPQVYSAKKV